MSKVAVVILNWNGKDFLQKFLPYVIKYSKGTDIYVADNASTDDSVSYVKANFPEVKIVLNDKNYGFADGYNKSLEKIDADYYVLLNSDVEVTDNWIHPIIDLMEKDKSIAACQPKILAYGNKSYFEYAGAGGGFIDKLGYPFCRGRVFETLEQDRGQYDDTIEIFWATGACMFVRANDYKAVNGLDGFYFAHMEEIDLCWRLKNIGKKIMYCGTSKVYHIGGATLDKSSPRKTFLNFRNSLLSIHKNAKRNKVFELILARLILDGVAGVKFLLQGKPQHTLALIKAHFSFYGALKQNKPKRIQSPSPNLKGIYNKSIVFQYYIKGNKKFNDLV